MTTSASVIPVPRIALADRTGENSSASVGYAQTPALAGVRNGWPRNTAAWGASLVAAAEVELAAEAAGIRMDELTKQAATAVNVADQYLRESKYAQVMAKIDATVPAAMISV